MNCSRSSQQPTVQQLCLKGSKHCSPASGQSPWCKGGNGDPPWAKTPPYSPSDGDAVRRQNLHTAWCSVCPRLGRDHEWAPNPPKEMIWTHKAQLETSPTELQWSLEVVPLKHPGRDEPSSGRQKSSSRISSTWSKSCAGWRTGKPNL